MLQRLIRVAGLSLLLILSVSGAITGLPANALAQAQPVSPASAAETYVLGPNDRVRLKVYGEPDIAGEYEVDNNGNVSVPLAGHIRAAGLTTRQLERAIASALSKGIVRDPRVNVEIALYRPYYILGEVKKGGEYPPFRFFPATTSAFRSATFNLFDILCFENIARRLDTTCRRRRCHSVVSLQCKFFAARKLFLATRVANRGRGPPNLTTQRSVLMTMWTTSRLAPL